MADKTSMVFDSLKELFNENVQTKSVPAVTAVDMDAIRQIIKEEIAKLPQQETKSTIEVKAPAHIQKLEGVQHERFEEVLQVISAGEPVYLYGPAGTGKSHIAESVAKALKLDFYMCNCVTQEFKLTGFIDAKGRYQETSFFKAFKYGGVFFIDELDGSLPEALININTALANGYFDFPCGRVDAHENFRCIAAGNTNGNGADEEYTGRFQLDAASMDRFYFVHIDYSEQIEKAIAGGNVEIVKFAHAYRQACSELGIKSLFSYRSIGRIAKLQGIIPAKRLLWGSLFKGLGIDTVIDILENIREVAPDNAILKAYRDDSKTSYEEIERLSA